MKWVDYKEHLKEAWEIHKRHPELLFIWSVLVGSWLYYIIKDK